LSCNDIILRNSTFQEARLRRALLGSMILVSIHEWSFRDIQKVLKDSMIFAVPTRKLNADDPEAANSMDEHCAETRRSSIRMPQSFYHRYIEY
jgi:hypothetical protein